MTDQHADTVAMSLHEMKRWSGPAGGAYIVECTCGWTTWTKADTPETSIESTFERHLAEHSDGPEQKPGRKSHDATSVRAPVSVTFCMDDGCRYAAGHDGPHDITWQAEHNDGEVSS